MRQPISGTKPKPGKVPFLLPVPTSAQPASKQEGFRAGNYFSARLDHANSQKALQGPKRNGKELLGGYRPMKKTHTRDAEIITDKELAAILFKDELKPTSWKTIQKMARSGDIKGKQVGRSWRFHRDAVRDFLLSRGNL